MTGKMLFILPILQMAETSGDSQIQESNLYLAFPKANKQTVPQTHRVSAFFWDLTEPNLFHLRYPNKTLLSTDPASPAPAFL